MFIHYISREGKVSFKSDIIKSIKSLHVYLIMRADNYEHYILGIPF